MICPVCRGTMRWNKERFACPVCGYDDTPKLKPTTNAERIRSMTDEELAEFITSPTPQGICKDRCGGDIDYPCSECALQWLKQEASE